MEENINLLNTLEIKQEVIDIYEEFADNEIVLEALRAEATDIKLEASPSVITLQESNISKESAEEKNTRNEAVKKKTRRKVSRLSYRKSTRKKLTSNNNISTRNSLKSKENDGGPEVIEKTKNVGEAFKDSHRTRSCRLRKTSVKQSLVTDKKRKTPKKDHDKSLRPPKDVDYRSKGKPRHQCDKCAFACPQAKKLKRHKAKCHKAFQCNQCSFQTNQQPSFEHHLFKHRYERPYICDVCSMDFKLRGKLQRHLRLHNNVKKYKCPVCSLAFAESYNLKSHTATHVDLYPHQCVLCSFSTKYKNCLKQHIATHSSNRKFICSLCNHTSKTKGALRSHLRSHGDHYYSCTQCSYRVRKKERLKTHTLIHHIRVPRLLCEDCHFSTYDPKSYNDHIESHQAFYPCIICFQIFKRKLTLDIHLERHKLLKDLQCSACSMKECCFKHKYYDLNLFQCDVCSKTFYKKSAIEDHIKRYHTS